MLKQFAVESWMGGWDNWTTHETEEEARKAAMRPAEWGRIWFAEGGFEADPATGSVSVLKTDPIQLIETWLGEEGDEFDGLEFEPYEDESEEFREWAQQGPAKQYRDDGFFPAPALP
ncbi:MAG: hypothetical protein EOM25_13195 [Deltaproteobacteria bacterium]|nr:hypothetical protein [Deltaproteobacteria bacterium]